MPDSIKNVNVKSFDLISRKNVLRNVSLHKTWNKEKCRCECLEIKDCDVGFSWNVVKCSCELKKMDALIVEEECDIETDDVIKNKTVTLIKK